ncbi:class I SAM-dependent methyltransferase [Bdellovibrio sp. BCCA]|uniref:class I SAM-dependent methyltransferase n=1 Tax=Bdellovibrio sp. BCCA TaxID=3136281 RepID=UPI0030F099FE
MDLMKLYFEWDVPNWSRSYEVWRDYIPSGRARCLEIGARRGGLSLMLAMNGNFVVCSDLESPETVAYKSHKRFEYSGQIHYKALDVHNIGLQNEFDVIIFKSVLGGVARRNDIKLAKSVAQELSKALRPGGLILFAENASGTFLHRLVRRVFRRWGNSWSYFTPDEMREIFEDFEFVEFKSIGFLAPFAIGKRMRSLFYLFDRHFDCFLSDNSKYITTAVLKKK